MNGLLIRHFIIGGLLVAGGCRMEHNSHVFDGEHGRDEHGRDEHGGDEAPIVDGPMSNDNSIDDANDDDASDDETAQGMPNLTGITLGGKQFWTDVRHFHKWRIQQHAWTDHYRLLDPTNRRRAWGAFEACEQKLKELADAEGLRSVTGEVVILLHGLGRSRSSMSGLGRYLEREAGFTVCNVGYASTRKAIGDHADALAGIIEHLGEVDKIHFVAHSMGNIVIRHFIADLLAEHGRIPDQIPLGRIVMLAPPNQGSQLARRFESNKLFHAVWGRSGKQLSATWDEIQSELATPPGEFGIISGGGNWSNNPLVEGLDDLIVSVEETKLAGASDSMVVRSAHTLIMNHPDVRKATRLYLQNGYFVSADERQPIAANE